MLEQFVRSERKVKDGLLLTTSVTDSISLHRKGKRLQLGAVQLIKALLKSCLFATAAASLVLEFAFLSRWQSGKCS